MDKIRNLTELREVIRDLEHQNYVNEQHMRHRVTEIAERLKPANLMRNLFNRLTGGSGFRANLLQVAAGLAASLFVKNFFKKGISR